MKTTLILVAAVSSVACGNLLPQKEKPTASASATVALPAPPPREPTLFDRARAQTELAAVMTVLKDDFEPNAVNDTPVATAVLAAWSLEHLKWEDIDGLSETSVAKVKKDAESEIGKKICSRGRVLQISVSKMGGKPLAEGLIYSPSGKPISFLAVGSSGDIEENSQARFCGIVTGAYSFSNVSGGQTQAVQAVGMFDLPENKPQKALAAQ